MPLSKKIFYVILAMLIGFASVSAYGFSAQVVASPQDKKMEWWFNQPANSAPHVIQISSVYFHQEFSLFSFFENASIKDGKFHIKYTITSTDPKGKKTIVAKDIVLDFKLSAAPTEFRFGVPPILIPIAIPV